MRPSINRFTKTLLASTALSVTAGIPVHAAKPSLVIDEIVVTASKREETIYIRRPSTSARWHPPTLKSIASPISAI